MVRAAYSAGKPALGRRRRQRPRLHRDAAPTLRPRRQRHRAVQDRSTTAWSAPPSRPSSSTPTIYDEALAEFARLHAHRASAAGEGAAGAVHVRRRRRGDANCAGARLNADGGRPVARRGSPSRPASACPTTPRSSWSRSTRVGPHEPLTREKLCPVLAVLRAPTSAEQAFELAERDGRVRRPRAQRRHPHRGRGRWSSEFGKRVKAVRIIWNSPVLAGRHRRHLQRVRPVADAGLRQLRPQLGVRQRLRRRTCSTSSGSARAQQQPAVVQGAGEDLLRAATPSATSPTCPTSTASRSSPTRP